MLVKSKVNKGFTLIEVVIVLAIAALIILVVLQAVGAAQRSNRDTARKSEAARMVSLLEQYASNNQGIYPKNAAAVSTMLSTYDPGLNAKYTVYTDGPAYVTTATGNAAWGKCSAPATSSLYEIMYTPSGNNRDYDLAVCTENGTSSLVHPQ